MMLALAAVCALSGAAASTAMAERCLRVEEAGTGNYNNPQCEKPTVEKGQFIQATPITQLPQHQWCAEVEEKGTGNYSDAQCTKGTKGGQFIKVWTQGPFWHVNGSQLKQGTRQIKLQAKGPTVLRGTALGGLVKVVIECKNSISEGASIEGRGSFQGQDKGRLIFTQCKFVEPAKCKIEEPIKTSQTKSYLAYNPNSKQQKFVDVFEPQQGTVFTVLKFLEKCEGLLAAEVTGSVAAEIIPIENEVQEGLLNFPEPAITTIIHEQVPKEIGLSFAGEPATFKAVYGARLQTNEPWGVF